MKSATPFPDIESIQVSVEERRILLGSLGEDNWRNYSYEGIESVPEILRPSFEVADTTEHEVNLHALIRQVIGERRQRVTFQLPYAEASTSAGQPGATVLRTINIQLTYKAKA